MSERHRSEFLSNIAGNASVAVNRMLATVDAERSKCSKLEDRNRIFEVVRSTVGFKELNSIIIAKLKDWIVAEMLKETQLFNDVHINEIIEVMVRDENYRNYYSFPNQLTSHSALPYTHLHLKFKIISSLHYSLPIHILANK